jgi:hypothetical protein
LDRSWKKYPKALDALKDIRDKKAARLVAGENNWQLFHDIAAINHQLSESKTTVELFKKIEVAQPEFASSISDLADEAFFAAKEYGLERKYLGDPCTRFDRAKSRLDWGLSYAPTSRYPARSRQSVEIVFSREIVRLIVVLDQTGDGDLARQIQSDALAACNTAAISDALTKELPYPH